MLYPSRAGTALEIYFSLEEHMRALHAAKQLAVLGLASMGLTISMSSTASADQAGVWMKDGHYFSIRKTASTSSAVVHSVTDPDARIPCTTTPCTRENDGGSYKCWSGGPSGNDWVKVKWDGKTGWVAVLCVEGGRI
ncbi:hypothetical protein [Streptomyces sp. NPDC052721]|uniref:hypothetical protein n=1 Tax=Streptomyces sp. NPDC052721 TaxID=3154955 RepID=UPI003442E61C